MVEWKDPQEDGVEFPLLSWPLWVFLFLEPPAWTRGGQTSISEFPFSLALQVTMNFAGPSQVLG